MNDSFSSMFHVSSSEGPPLRIGILLDDRHLTRAFASVLDDLRSASFVSVELLVLDADAARPRRRRWGRGLAFGLYERFDRRRVGSSDDPLEMVDCTAELADVDAIEVTPIRAGRTRAFPDDAVARVRAARLDVLIQLGVRDLRGDILDAAAYGVWSIRSGNTARFAGEPPCFWEIVEGERVCGAVLERLPSSELGGIVLDTASFPIDPGSLARTRRQALYGATHLVIRNLRLLHQSGWERFASRHLPAPQPRPGVPVSIDRTPRNHEVIAWFAPLIVRKVFGIVVRRLSRSDNVLHWRMALRLGHDGLRLDQPPDMTGFTWIESPSGHFYADPFVVERKGRHWLFYEDFSYAERLGTIDCAEILAEGELAPRGRVLGSVGHLSYPMVVVDGEDTYMVPESSADGLVGIYRAVDFPLHWELIARPYSGAAVDTSVWQHDGRWWFFTTVREPRGKAAMLMLFHAATIDGPWVPHPLNPISQDARVVRGAGGLFSSDGRLIRPSQDGTRGYGFGFTLNEVTVLTETDYAERPGPTIEPDWSPGLLGTHTYNRAGDVEVTDGKVLRRRAAVL